MATTALQVFNYTMALLDEINDAGSVNVQNTVSYQAKTPLLLTLLEYDICRKQAITPIPLTSINDNVNSTDDVAVRILPYGLAAQLLITEDPSTASFYNQRYEELKKQIPTSFVAITDVYADEVV